MSTNENSHAEISEEAHPPLEIILLETYLKEKGYSLEELPGLPEEESRLLMKEAATYATSRLAEVEVSAHLMQILHNAYIGD